MSERNIQTFANLQTVAEELDCSRHQAFRLVALNKIPSYELMGRTLVKREDLDLYKHAKGLKKKTPDYSCLEEHFSLSLKKLTHAALPYFVYFLSDEIGRVVYVGISKNVMSRVNQHRRFFAGKFRNISYIELPDHMTYRAEEIEGALIKFLSPALNKKGVGPTTKEDMFIVEELKKHLSVRDGWE